MVEVATGTITTLQSLYPAEEALKAVRRVEDAISDRGDHELCRLQGFVSDNSGLIKLVRTLPDELSHDIMVPFGDAAFFPGRLIHTNEFLVLLGENYYAERTGKQTMQILQRRQKAVKAQVLSLESTIANLELEAKFFRSTAAESAEGFVEIHEYTTEPQNDIVGSEADISINHDEYEDGDKDEDGDENKDKDEDVYNKMMAKLDELVKEELDDRSTSASDENEDDEVSSDHEDIEQDEVSSDHEDIELNGVSSDHEDTEPVSVSVSDHKHEELKKAKEEENLSSITDKNVGSTQQQHLALKSSMVDQKVSTADRAFPRNEMSEIKKEPQTLISSAEPMPLRPEEHSGSAGKRILDSGSTAFTGSIVEHEYGLPPISSSASNTSGQSSDSGPSKPVSRFKMQRGARQ